MSRTSLPAPGGGPSDGRDVDGNWVVGNAYLNAGGNGSAAAWDISDLARPRTVNLNPAGSQYSVTNAIRGDAVVGISQPAGQAFNHAYEWELTTGVARDLHALLPASMNAKGSSASDVIGPIVIGNILTESDALEPVIWNTTSQEVVNLKQYLPAGTTFASATAINDKGQIVGDFWKADGVRSVYVLTPAVPSGDANFDSRVDTIDFNILATHFSRANGDWGVADFTADGFVDTLDFNLLAANFGSTLGGTSVDGLVPEPGSFAMFIAAAVLLASRQRNARSAGPSRDFL